MRNQNWKKDIERKSIKTSIKYGSAMTIIYVNVKRINYVNTIFPLRFCDPDK